MAKLEKLKISGIRNFSPFDDKQQIKFTSPLTLILGQNGCGKTTIIEAIKYACCDEVPPGTGKSGPGFINDPKLSDKTAVMGQVRLKIVDHDDGQLTVVRTRKVTQMKNAAFPKLGEKTQTIRHMKKINGEEVDVSGRCVDINQYVCQILSVSQSILSNVIFCHQENSLWPLDEGKSVKEKFDQIFDSEKYNKSVDIVLDCIKKKRETIKSLKTTVENARTLKETVETKRHQLEEKQDKLQRLDDEIDNKLTQKQPIIDRIHAICEVENQLGDLQKQVTTKEVERKSLIEQKKKITSNASFEEFTSNDDELNKKIETFQNDQLQYSNNIEKLELKKTEIENRIKTITTTSEKTINDIGQLAQEKNQFDRKCNERLQLFEKIQFEFDDLKLNQYDFNKDSSIIIENLNKKLSTFDQKIKELIDEKDIERNNLQKQLDEIREKSIKTQENIKTKQNSIVDNKTKIEKINEKLKQIDNSSCELVKIRKKIEETDGNVEKLKSKFNESEQNKRVNEIRMENYNKEQRLEEFERELKILQQNAVNNGKIDLEKQSVQEKLQEIDRIKNKNMENFKFLFEDKIPEKNLKQTIESLQTKNSLIVKNLTNNINQQQQEITVLETKKLNQTQSIQTNENDLKIKEEKIKEICAGREFNDLLNDVIEKREKLQKDKGYYNSGKIIYERYIEEFRKTQPCCPVCMTKFDKAKQREQQLIKNILKNLQAKITKVPEVLEKTNAELKQQDDLYDKLQQLKNVNDEIDVIKNCKLPLLQDDLKQIESDLNKKSLNLQNLKKELIQPQKIVDYCGKLISDVTKIDQNQQFIEQSQKNIKNLQAELVKISINKTKHELEVEIDTLKNDLNKNRQSIDNIVKSISTHKDHLQRLLNERNNLMGKQLEFEKLLRDEPNLEKEKIELNEIIEKLEREVVVSETELNSINLELSNFETKKNQIVQNNKDLIDNKREKYQKQKEMYDKIKTIQNEIDRYEKSNINKRLSDLKVQLEDFKEKEKQLNVKKEEMIDLISKTKEEIVKCELKFRNLQDNRSLRDIQKQIEQLDNEINELNRKHKGYNHRSLFDEKQQLSTKHQKLEQEINKIRGQKDELIVTINDIKTELNIPRNKNAYKNYMSKFYELRITEISIQDLIKYVKALEKSLIDFHQRRMKEINNTIREYWRNTYRGNDIEYIEIKSEYSTATNNNRRIYNYRVVQVKDQIELDMRGRSSAGQKVLACLIIRLAIAETLASRCGILALDEPTTNLDHNNIESLSKTLSRIIEYRQRERNFQLLIITHDEDFLKTITRSHHVPYFYRITRNPQGFSNITREYSL